MNLTDVCPAAALPGFNSHRVADCAVVIGPGPARRIEGSSKQGVEQFRRRQNGASKTKHAQPTIFWEIENIQQSDLICQPLKGTGLEGLPSIDQETAQAVAYARVGRPQQTGPYSGPNCALARAST